MPCLTLSIRILLWFSIVFRHSYVLGLDMNADDPESIKSTAKTIAEELLTWYHGDEPGQTPGILPGPYYWWEAGGMWGTLLEYAYYTGDTSYNKIITDGLLWQVGPHNDFLTPNQTKAEGNDDQAFWAFAALTAAELKFPDPPPSQPQWLALAQAVFNQQIERWDTKNCNGGLRWQIYNFNTGWTYKNTISNGGLFFIAARLARFTHDPLYVQWAAKVYDWLASTPLLDAAYHVYDGSDITKNCTDADHHQWSYNYGVLLAGSAYMYNHTGDLIWHDRTHGLLQQILDYFFPTLPQFGNGTIFTETDCEVSFVQTGKAPCDIADQRTFKAFTSRWLAVTAQLVPSTRDLILPKLRSSAQAAAKLCAGPKTGSTCSQNWFSGTYDGTNGPGEQMSALSIISGLLIESAPPPVAMDTGGTSKGDPTAGKGDPQVKKANNNPIGMADKVGAWVLTVVILAMLTYLGWWLSCDGISELPGWLPM